MDSEEKAKLLELAERLDMKMSDVVREALRMYEAFTHTLERQE